VKKELTTQEWQSLEQHLSKPIDESDKMLIIDFIDFYFEWKKSNEEFYNSCKHSKIKPEFIKFKKAIEPLIGNDLPERRMKAARLYKSLSKFPRDMMQDYVFQMTRSDNADSLHPSQYYCAATLCLESISKPLTKSNPKGAGRPENSLEHIYESLEKLWEDLGETVKTISYNSDLDKASTFLKFNYALLNMLGDNRKIGTVYKDLRKLRRWVNLMHRLEAASLVEEK